MFKITRREFNGAMTALPVMAIRTPAPERALRHIAGEKNILFGSMATVRDISDPSYAKLITSECAILTPGIEAKWRTTEPEDGAFQFGPMDTLAQFAGSNGLALHMHNLIWGVDLPPWVPAALAQGRGPAIMARHISTVARRYRGRVQSWDVINEAVDPRWPADKLGVLTTPWWHGVGADYIFEAFAEAAAADPSAQLMLNDDDLEYASHDRDQKRTTYLRLIEAWLRRGMKIQAFGLETHLKPWLPIAEQPYRQFLRELAGLGLKLRITEFDVNDHFMPTDIATRDRMVANATKNFLDIALDEARLDTLIVWGLSDRASWMQWDRTARRPDHGAARPSPYDANLVAKPMRQAIAAALQGARTRAA